MILDLKNYGPDVNWIIQFPELGELEYYSLKKIFKSYLLYLIEADSNVIFRLRDFEGTGNLGDRLSQHKENNKVLEVDPSLIEKVMDDPELQLIELELEIKIKGKTYCKLMVRDGSIYEIVGYGELPPSCLFPGCRILE